VFTVGRRPFLRTFALNIGGNTHSYIFQVFMGSYLIQTVGVDRRWCRRRCWSERCSGARRVRDGVLDRPLRPPPGDHRGGRVPGVFPAPAFLMLDTGNTALIVLVIVLGFVFAAYGTVGSQAAAFAELAGSRLPLRRRGAGPRVLRRARRRDRPAALRRAGAAVRRAGSGW
jgi:hypothetical protein